MKVEDSKKNNQNTTNNQSQKQIISDIPIFSASSDCFKPALRRVSCIICAICFLSNSMI